MTTGEAGRANNPSAMLKPVLAGDLRICYKRLKAEALEAGCVSSTKPAARK